MKISASILDLTPKTKENLEKIENSGVNLIHIDVMDGKFVLNKTLSYQQMETFLNDFPFDVHLMVQEPEEYIENYSNINPEYITFHYETGDVLKHIQSIKSRNIKVGMSIKPDTKVEEIQEYLPYLDLVLIMSVEPGLGGQSFLENTFSKVDALYEIRKSKNLNFQIEVDGGINPENISKLKKCDILVVGSFITKGDYKEQMNKIRKALQ